MPITHSAKKALRQNARHRQVNLARAKTYKKEVKDYRKLILEKRPEDAKVKLVSAYKALDKAAKTGTIKKNKANRLKSRLAKRLY